MASQNHAPVPAWTVISLPRAGISSALPLPLGSWVLKATSISLNSSVVLGAPMFSASSQGWYTQSLV